MYLYRGKKYYIEAQITSSIPCDYLSIGVFTPYDGLILPFFKDMISPVRLGK